LFHTVEGGGIFTNDSKMREKCFLLHTFGHLGDEYFITGINGKNSEFHAAMGLCTLPAVDSLISSRKKISELYDHYLSSLGLTKPVIRLNTDYNYAYYPVIFPNQEMLLRVKSDLQKNGIAARRYFFP